MLIKRLKNSRVLIVVSMWMILAFNLVNFIARRFLKPMPNTFGEGLIDGTAGMFLGMALATMFFAFRMKARETGGGR